METPSALVRTIVLGLTAGATQHLVAVDPWSASLVCVEAVADRSEGFAKLLGCATENCQRCVNQDVRDSGFRLSLVMLMERLEAAVHNNAAWCDTICRAHGGRCDFGNSAWLNRAKSPPLYPNMITLTPGPSRVHLASIKDLVAEQLPPGWSVKDSFASLDLTSMGFRVLFSAAWLDRDPTAGTKRNRALGVFVIRRKSQFVEWQTQWDRSSVNSGALASKLFSLQLLTIPDLAFIACHRDGEVVGGAVANRSAGVIGLTNVFHRDGEALDVLDAVVGASLDRFGPLPLVGYLQPNELERWEHVGFVTIGRLRVWVSDASAA